MGRFVFTGIYDGRPIEIIFEHRTVASATEEWRLHRIQIRESYHQQAEKRRNYRRFHGTGNPVGSANSDRRPGYAYELEALGRRPSVQIFGQTMEERKFLEIRNWKIRPWEPPKPPTPPPLFTPTPVAIIESMLPQEVQEALHEIDKHPLKHPKRKKPFVF